MLAKTDPIICATFNFLPKDKISDGSKLKAFADDKIVLTEELNFVFGRVENTLLFTCFRKAYFPGSLNVVIVW